jgi:hypothetical protein
MDIFELRKIPKSDFMSIRSANYIALKPGVTLTDEVRPYLEPYQRVSDARGALFVFESNRTPLWARPRLGENGTLDLEEDLAIQRFLGRLEPDQYRMLRIGFEQDFRGSWESHGFKTEPGVQQIEETYHYVPDHLPGSDF